MRKRVVILAIFSLLMVSCAKKNEVSIRIYGTVLSESDGSPRQNVSVVVVNADYSSTLNGIPVGNASVVGSTVTGSDGFFEFSFTHTSEVTTYYALFDDYYHYPFNVDVGNSFRMDVIL